MILESGGHVATIVSNGEDALDALERANFDIALFDLSMPIVSGLEALKLYRFAAAKPIPVIILSANVTTDAHRRMPARGRGRSRRQASAPRRCFWTRLNATSADEAEQFTAGPPARSDDRPALTVVDTPPLDPLVMGELANFSSTDVCRATDTRFSRRLRTTGCTAQREVLPSASTKR